METRVTTSHANKPRLGHRVTKRLPRRSPKRTIVVAVDFSDVSKLAMEYAVSRAKLLKCAILMVCVVERAYGEGFLDRDQLEQLRLERRQAAEARLSVWAASGRMSGVSMSCEVRSGVPAIELLRAAKATNTEMIVVARASHNPLTRLIFGSVTENLLDASPFPVLVLTFPKKSRREKTV
jgi:nucleotide-binding universal stress UspA family protein